jgi:hypothetical protein
MRFEQLLLRNLPLSKLCGRGSTSGERCCVPEVRRWLPPSDVIAVASDVIAVASDAIAVASDVIAVASDVIAVASDVIAAASDVIAAASDVIAVASDVIAAASNVIAAASVVIAAASDVIAAASAENRLHLPHTTACRSESWSRLSAISSLPAAGPLSPLRVSSRRLFQLAVVSM